jgi:ribonuclease HII
MMIAALKYQIIHRRTAGVILKARLSSSDILKREIELDLHKSGYHYVIGVDEAGRGPLAGPVVASAVVCLPTHKSLLAAADSKALTEKRREQIYDAIKADPTLLSVSAIINHDEIDRINILQATMVAMHQCVESLLSLHLKDVSDKETSCYALIDGNKCPNHLTIKSRAIVKGDALVYPIAMASIVAKVERDRIMVRCFRMCSYYIHRMHE